MVLQINANLRFPALLSLEYFMCLVNLSLFSSMASKKSVKIRIEYAMKGYKMATNNRAFGMLSLWSQIGGFVGMFLGLSLLQLPIFMSTYA